MYLLAMLLPCFGGLLAGIGAQLIGHRGAAITAVTSTALAFVISLAIWFEVGFLGSTVYVDLGAWFNIGSFGVNWAFAFDPLSAAMMLIVTFVSSGVQLYSIAYMRSYPHVSRFMSYLCFFTFFMLFLVAADSLLLMLIGFEGIGVCSYLLIGFWLQRANAAKSAAKAMVVNRASDCFLMISIIATWWAFLSTEYSVLLIQQQSVHSVDLLCFAILAGVMAKSAVIGLHVWLADAMEGPTPVSALIHAATLVTAGIYVLARTNVLLDCSPLCRFVIVALGSLSCVFAAIAGLFQSDMKRVIAYSTCSQLGYMTASVGLGGSTMAVFHLLTHACFKALLFLAAGIVILAMLDTQDVRRHGSLTRILPFCVLILWIGSLCLIGWPFFAGFFSKDAILEASMVAPGTAFATALLTIGTLFTAYYSFRLLLTVSSKEFGGHRSNMPAPAVPSSSSRAQMTPLLLVPVLVLAIAGISVGLLFGDFFVGIATDSWGKAISSVPNTHGTLGAHFLSRLVNLVPTAAILLGAFACYYNSKRQS